MCGVFKDAVRSSQNAVQKENNIANEKWKEAVTAKCEVASSLGGNKENNEKPQSERSRYWMGFERGTFRIQIAR
jgi:hypothetical protein